MRLSFDCKYSKSETSQSPGLYYSQITVASGGREHSRFRLSESAGEDILTAFRGFCLLILKNTYCRNISKRIRSHTLFPLIPIVCVLNV